jgi:RHS repeat-associated protein
MASSIAFLYSGPNAVQIGVAPGTIDVRRVGVVRGRVIDRSGAPVPDVGVRVLGHPELGATYTRADGAFDLAANGGGPVTLVYEKPALISAQRVVAVPWLDFVAAPDVVMIGLDAAATDVDMTEQVATQVARGSPVVDPDGARQATAMFAPGTTATMVLPDGTQRQLTSIRVRATEFTVGANGPATMPAELPPSSGYTYAVDMSIDQAVLAGAKQVLFSQPVPIYVDDFLHFPVGQVVPVGYYDPDQGAWIASPNGVIVAILSVTGGMADLDVDGSGTAAGPTALAALGVTDGERAQLASLYAPGATLWRGAVSHFSLIDYNWPYGFPPGSSPPPKPKNPAPKPDCSSPSHGSIIECESQQLGEEIPIAGTDYKLSYSTLALSQRTLDFTVSGGDALPSSLKRIDLVISVAGQSKTVSFQPTQNQTYRFAWDGNDVYGRPVIGTIQPKATLHYVYPVVYYAAPAAYYASFAQFPGVSFQSSTFWSGERVYTGDVIGGRDYPGQGGSEIFASEQYPTDALQGGDVDLGLGGWTLDVHQSFQQGRPGSLSVLSAPHTILPLSNVIGTIAGGGAADPVSSEGGPATGAQLSYPLGVAHAADGSFYVADQGRVRHVTHDGVIHTVAGCGGKAAQCDGTIGPGGGGYGSAPFGAARVADVFTATNAASCIPGAPPCVATRVAIQSPSDVAVGPDGSVYVADAYGAIYRVSADGSLVVAAGMGQWGGFSGDGGPALDAMINPSAIAVGPDGAIYIAEAYNSRVRRVGPDGIISTVAGDGTDGYSGDGGAAVVASIGQPVGVAVGPDGTLYIASQHFVGASGSAGWIRSVGADGRIYTLAGNSQALLYSDNPDFDGLPATLASVLPSRVAVAQDGTVYFDTRQRMYRISPDGTLLRVAGNDQAVDAGDGGLATAASLSSSQAFSVGPNGTLLVASSSSVRSVAPFTPAPVAAPPSWNVLSNVYFYPVDDQVFVFDTQGRHLRTVDRMAERPINELVYGTAGLLAGVRGTFGELTQIQRDASGKPTAIVAPGGERTLLSIGADGYLASVTTPAGDTSRMVYAQGGLLTQYTDARGGVHAFAYDDGDRLVSDQGPGGQSTLLTRTDLADGFQVTTTTALGRMKTYGVETLADGTSVRTVVDERGGITQTSTTPDGTTTVTQADGTTWVATLAPDPVWGMMAPYVARQTVTTPDGTTSVVTRTVTSPYNGSDDPVNATRLETITSGGETWTQAFDGNARTLTQTTPGGGPQTVTQYDLYGRAASVAQTDPSSGATQTTTNTYDASGLLVGVVSPAGSWTFTHDAGFRVASSTDAAGNTTSVAYDANGRPAVLTEPSGAVTTLAYDALGNVVSRTRAGATTSYAYDAAGNLVSAQRPDGSRVAYTYDADGRFVGKSDSTGGSIAVTLDAAGNRIREDIYDAGGGLRNTLTRAFDLRNRVTRTTTGAGQVTSSTYAAGQEAVVTDGLGDQVTYAYDGNDVLSSFTDASGAATAYAFDDAQNLQTVTDARGEATLAQYDGLGNHLSTMSPDTGTTSFGYDAFGRTTSRTDARGVTTSYGHDAAGRFTSIAYSTGAPGVTFTYDEGALGAGKLTGIAEGVGTTRFGYDAQGHVVREDKTIGGVTWTVTRAYNGYGWVTSTAVAPGGATITYGRDANGRVSRITASDGHGSRVLVSGVTYLPFGPLASMTLGNGVTVSRAFDQDYRLTRLTAGSALDRSYAYDAAGDLASITDAVDPGSSEAFSYDAAGRLIHATGAYGDEAYTYDAVGNRTSITRDGATDAYAYAAASQRLLGVTGGASDAYAYDASGNATTAGALTLAYDENNRLSSASIGGQILATYESSVVGQRVRKTDAAGNVTVYLYDGMYLLATADGDGNLVDQHVYLGGTRVAVLHGGRIDDADVSYVVNDHRGAPVVLLDQGGQVAWAATYRPFGEATVTASAVTNDLRLPGQIYDPETGLHDNRLRAYDPRTGRYLQSDPIGLSGGMATYAYATQSPNTFVDPFGLGKVSASVYDGVGGGVSVSWDSHGVSYCAEVGAGAGASLSYSPFANADPTKQYLEASAKASLGPSSIEAKIGVESAPCGTNGKFSGSITSGPLTLQMTKTVPLDNPVTSQDSGDGKVSLKPSSWVPNVDGPIVQTEVKAVAGACYHF